jgi:RNA-directed DNA polymerase
MKSDRDLILFLGIQSSELNHLINSPEYSELKIKKRRGGLRILEIPEKRLMKLQRTLNNYLQEIYITLKPESSHGFVRYQTKGPCNIHRNAAAHCSSQCILSLDLKDFFSSVSASRIQRIFLESPFGFNVHLANCLTLLMTYKGYLPQGAPTSPVLSNFGALGLDAKLERLSRDKGVNYTRYADDLTFSSKDSDFQNDFIDEVKFIIRTEGFTLNTDKTRLRSKNRKQMVTGIVVNKKPNIDRKYLRKLRAILYDCEQNGIQLAASKHFKLADLEKKHIDLFIRKLNGMILFVKQIRGEKDNLCQNLSHRYQQIVEDYSL